MNYPLTRAEAEAKRYGQWTANQRGDAFSQDQCAAMVWPNRLGGYILPANAPASPVTALMGFTVSNMRER